MISKIQSLEITTSIITNKAFQRLAEKTQVIIPKNGREETVQNRLTHSYQVANSAKIISETINLPTLNIDYQNSLFNTCLLHDIGHPPFGHEGAKILNETFSKLGIKEGFSDNNNNFKVINKNQIKVNDYTLASLIKYPNKLYESDKEFLLYILEKSINEDIEYFSKYFNINEKPKRTVACEIMDEADRNAYVCFDLADCYSLGISSYENIENLYYRNLFTSLDIKKILLSLIEAIKEKNKSLIKNIFSEININLNKNYILKNNLQLGIKNEEWILLREELYKIEKEIFINSEYVLSQREQHIQKLNKYIEKVLNGFTPSKTYAKLIENSSSENAILKYQRDMIAEVTDWYILNQVL